jgi:hypothetical protein
MVVMPPVPMNITAWTFSRRPLVMGLPMMGWRAAPGGGREDRKWRSFLTLFLPYGKGISKEEISIMKPSTLQSVPESFNKDLLSKISAIEHDVVTLKMSVLKKLAPTGEKVIKLKGILKGNEITEEDIYSAITSLYSKTDLS